jgi:hypothetical protein
MSPYLYRRLMHEKLARLRQHPDPAPSHTRGAPRGVCSRSTRSLPYGHPTRGREEPCREPRSPYRQLNQRTADGLAVTLEWNPTTDALRIVVVDHAREAVTFPVRAADASDAFVHPFIYAGRAVGETA